MSAPPCELSKDLLQCNPGFDYEGSKARYFKAIAENPPVSHKFLYITRERFAQIVQYFLKCETAAAKGVFPPTLTRKQQYYKQMELYRGDGDVCLIKKRASLSEPIIKHLAIEDSFDVYVDLHLRHSHCGRDKLRRLVKQQYQICNKYCDIFIKCCNICKYRLENTKKKPLKQKPLVKQKEIKNNEVIETDDDKKFLLDIFNMTVPDGDFKFVLFCRDMSTSYLLLRPLIEKCHKEVATELLQIVLTFGSPSLSILTRPSNQDFFVDTIMIMKQFGLNLQITSIENVSDSKHMDLFSNAKAQLETWMTKNSTNWGLGCHVVQWQLNNKQHHYEEDDQVNQEKTPYANMFGRFPVYPPMNDEPPEQSMSRIASEGNIDSFETMSHSTNVESSISEDTPGTFSYSAELITKYLGDQEATTKNMDDTS